MNFVLVLFVVVAISLGLVVQVRRSRRVNEAWARAGRELGLRFEPGSLVQAPTLHGGLEGFHVKVDTFRKKSGNNSTAHTRFRIRYPEPLGLGLSIKGQGVFAAIAQLFGQRDILTGDAAFDNAVLVKGAWEERVVEFLTPGRRVRIRRLFSSYRDAVVEDDHLEWSRRGAVASPALLVQSVQHGLELARSLTGSHSADHSIARVLRARHEGRIDEAMTVLEASRTAPREEKVVAPAADAPPATGRELVENGPPLPSRPDRGEAGLEERVLEGGMLYLAGRRSEARQTFEEALERAPEDEEIRGWVEHVSRDEPADAPTHADGAPLDVETVCGALFHPGVTSYDIGRIFEERHAGRRVRWSGKLRSVETYTYDYVFGSGPGTKAVFEIFRTEVDVYSEEWVLAVVQLPEDAREPLDGRVGETLSFEGLLERADGFMKNLFLVKGALS